MKTTCMYVKKIQITVVLALITVMLCLNFSYGQRPCKVDQYLESLPTDLELKEPVPQKYLMTAIYYNKDIYGNFSDKTQVSGEYTRGLDEGYVKWNNVRIAQSSLPDGPFPEGQKQDYMENFRYLPSENMVDESAFRDFPPMSFHAKNLIWDMMGIEIFAWTYFDSLKLNEAYSPLDLSGSVPLAGEGYFNNKNIELTWTGISKMNGELCAIIQYSAMDNTLEINSGDNAMSFSAKGRSHYWGNVWVSLEDKQIEYTVLYEDVIMDMQFSESNNQIINTTRELKLEKLN